jgi:glycosyltransferase involved in cell wall biosynthesis
MPAPSPPSVTLVFQSRKPLGAALSGSVAGVAAAASSDGYRVLLRNGELPLALGRAIRGLGRLTGARAAAAFALVRLTEQRGELALPTRAHQPQIVFSSESAVDLGSPFVTFEDMTVAQTVRQSGYDLSGLTASHRRWWEERQRMLYGAAVGCCVGSEWAASSVVEDYGIPREKVHVVGRGHTIAAERVDRDFSTPQYLFSGRDWTRKNGSRVIEAFRRVKAQRPDAVLHLVGPGPGDRSQHSGDGVLDHGLLDLESATDRRRLLSLYATATCFVMPSLCEAFGISYLEAAAHGLPCIGTTCGGAAEAIGAGGMVADPLDVGAIADAMLALADPDRAAHLGELARENAERFTWPRVTERLLDVLAGADGTPMTAIKGSLR